MISEEHLPIGVHGWLFDPVIVTLPGPLKSKPFKVGETARFYSKTLGRWVVIPRGYRFDMLSIPRPFWIVLPPSGEGRRAALVHDFLVSELPHICSSRMAAKVFKEAMDCDSLPKWKIKVMYRAVRLFGPHFKQDKI